MNVNLKGASYPSRRQTPQRDQRPGKIINISSVHEELPFPHFTAYCASKVA